MKRLRLLYVAVILFVAGVGLYFWLNRPRPPAPGGPPPAGSKGGNYADLTPAQKRLVDDWVQRFNATMGKQVSPVEIYGDLALSTKTTFNAVTHALSQTKLTDKAGQPMNLTALDIVRSVNTVVGSAPGKGGDKQFRMYVELKPDAQQTLEKCREFSRQVDNTIYHKGYPTCFRGATGTPSIQVSMSRNGKHGDIDVDYRSSSFPVMLVNGHLTASNSDVRAGDNDQRHVSHWSGLANWWRGFMGLPMFELPHVEKEIGSPVASEPRLGKGTRPEEAIYDFLNAWLVEQNPGVAVGYVAPRAFACMEMERGVAVDRGMARFQLLRAMQSVNQVLGKAGKLDDVISGVSLTGPRGKVIEQPHHAQFVMYDVREDLVEQADCENRLHPESVDPKKARSTSFGEYVGAVFRLKSPTVKGETVATFWTREKGVWTLVAYDVEPELKPGAFPGPPPAEAVAAEPALPVVEGDPAMKRAAEDFFEAWFVRKDTNAAFRYLSPACYPCYNVYRPGNLPAASSPEEASKLLRERMKQLADWPGTGKRLDDYLTGVEPHHPDLKLVKHDQAAAFTLVSIPDWMGAAANCANMKPGESPRFDHSGSQSYGKFYAASTRLKKAGPDAAVLWAVWSKQGGEWKIGSYLVIAP